MNPRYKEYYEQVANKKVSVDKDTLFAIIDRLLNRIEELEALLERQ